MRKASNMALLMLMMGFGVNATAPLTGSWGGDRTLLTLGPDGGSFKQDCASGTIAGPIHLDAHGRFTASGRFEKNRPGPQPADVPLGEPARFEGQVKGQTLQLVVHPASGGEQKLTLTSGRRVKLIRCL